jgi:predicted Zn-ribbon and HTH transcriptional regulator
MENSRDNALELATVFRQYAHEYQRKHSLCSSQRKAYNAIMHCRTSALGLHQSVCDSCGYKKTSYNSCRNRHCPKCQYIKQLLWVDKLKNRLLPTRYFHIVFTVPEFLNGLFYINQRACYDMLFKASAYAIQKTTSNPAFLGAQSGNLSVLHTWGQSLNYHPHIHALVPAGGMDADEQEWIHAPKKFFVPVQALSKIFRAKLYQLMEQALKKQLLIIPEKGRLLYDDLKLFKSSIYGKLWHVHIKKTFKGAGQVLNYLGRYTHRVAISNNRLVSLSNNVIHFRWKDYRDNRLKVMELDVLCFIRRFLQHILPCGYYKIRYFGIFSAIHAKTSMVQCFALLSTAPGISQYEGLPMTEVLRLITGRDLIKCPECKKGTMVLVGTEKSCPEDP